MKNLQKLMAVFALFLGLTAAFAFKSKDKLNFNYGVSGQTTTSWIVVRDITDEVEGEEYECGTTSTLPCTITSNSTIQPGSKIPKTGAAIITPNQVFVP